MGVKDGQVQTKEECPGPGRGLVSFRKGRWRQQEVSLGAPGVSWGEVPRTSVTSLPMACGQSRVLSSVNQSGAVGGVGECECGSPSLGLEARELGSDVDSDCDPRQVPDLSVPPFPCPNFRLKNRIR